MVVAPGPDTVNDTLLELVKTVGTLGAKLEAVETTLCTVQTEVADLKSLAAAFRGSTKALWGLIGLLAGAGGTEAVQAFLAG